MDGCFSNAAAAVTKIMQAKAYGVFAIDDAKGLALVVEASERLVTPAQQAARAALGVAGAF